MKRASQAISDALAGTIKRARLELGLTQLDLALRAGVSLRTIGAIETPGYSTRPQSLNSVLLVLRLSAGEE